MIATLRGRIADKQAGKVVVDAGGVGYEVSVPVETYSHLGEPGEEAFLHVHTHMRDAAISLFGFHNPRDKGLFEKFIEVSGVGPRLALTLLSGLSTNQLLGAIRTGDTKALIRIPGVGKKTGGRIILELKDKLDAFGDAAEEGAGGAVAVEEEVISVLVGLGSKADAAARAVRAARRKGAPAEFERLFREAMQLIKR